MFEEEEKRQISSSIKYGHGNLCEMKMYATLRTLGLISVVISSFNFIFVMSASIDYLCVFIELWFCISCKRRSLLNILHTHKRCGFLSQEGQGSR